MIETTEPGGSEEREEGEIVDDEGEIVDDFEAISDYSIQSPSNSGKSVSPQGLLQDVSLSSISNSEDTDVGVAKFGVVSSRKCQKRKNVLRKRTSSERRSKRRRKSEEYHPRSGHAYKKRRHKNVSTDSDDNKLDYRTLKQLKDAIRIDTSREVQQKSLRTRLKAMIHLDTLRSPVEEDEIQTLRTLALLSNTKIDEMVKSKAQSDLTGKEQHVENNEGNRVDEKDEELIELRLAALKSAIIKKATERKKRKENLGFVEGDEVNKENDVNRENNQENCACKEEDVIVISDAGTNESNCDGVDKEVADVNNAVVHDTNLIATVGKEILKSNDNEVNTTIEEDVDIMRAMLLASMSKRITSNVIKNSAGHKIPIKENFNCRTNMLSLPQKQTNALKNLQMPTVKPLIINLNNESDSDTDAADKWDKSKTDLHGTKDKELVNTVTQFLKQQRAAVEAKSKQQIKTIREPSLDKSVLKLLPKSQQREYQLLKQKLLLARKKRLRKPSQKIDYRATKKFAKVKPQNMFTYTYINRSQQEMDLSGLQKTLEDMQIQKNGRLQMKGKYKELAPLLREVNQASVDRKQCEMEIKRLLEDLKKTRNKLATSHQRFTNLVKVLMKEKDAIDRRPNEKAKNQSAIVLPNVKCTSTPIKPSTQEDICDIICINELSVIGSSAGIGNNMVERVNEVEECNINENNVNNFELPVNKYVSPLDTKNRDDVVNDPLTTFCPYELFGVCKDPECKFNHCSSRN